MGENSEEVKYLLFLQAAADLKCAVRKLLFFTRPLPPGDRQEQYKLVELLAERLLEALGYN